MFKSIFKEKKFQVKVKDLIAANPCTASKKLLKDKYNGNQKFSFPDVIDEFPVIWLLWVAQEFCPNDQILSVEEYENTKATFSTNKEKREFDNKIKEKLLEVYG